MLEQMCFKERGWEALKNTLKKRGIISAELREAQSSFYNGIEILSRLFLFSYPAEKEEKRTGSPDKK